MRDALNSLVSSIFMPPFCGHCHTYLSERRALCVSCTSLIESVPSDKVGSLMVHAMSGYEYPLKSLVGKSYERSEQLGRLLGERFGVLLRDVDCIVPVPRYRTEEVKRGYSASLVMAQQISRLRGVPIIECVRRVAPPVRKELYTKVEYYRVNKTVFSVTPDISEIEGKSVLLVDEVCLTGSTLVEVAQLVSLGRPKRCEALALCMRVGR